MSASKKKPDNPNSHQNLFSFNYLLSDFGMAVKINSDGLPLQVSAGDQAFMPPESLDVERLKSNNLELTKIDIFSLGLILYLMMFGRQVPLTGPEWERERDPAIFRTRLGPLAYSERLKELVLRCLSTRPIERPSAAELLMTSCSIRREFEVAEQTHYRRQAATLNRRVRGFQSTVQSPTTSSQFVPFASSPIFHFTEEPDKHEQRESFPHPISPGLDNARAEAKTHF